MSLKNEPKSHGSTAQLEVDKLKELVKKLERQNEHLRNRTGKLSPNPKSGGDGHLFSKSAFTNNYSSLSENGSDQPKFANKKLSQNNEDDEINKLMMEMGFNSESDGNWLYSSPKKSSSFNTPTPEKWLSEELDNPSTPQLKAAKEEILNQLNPPYARPLFNNYSTPIKVTTTGTLPLYKMTPGSREKKLDESNSEFQNNDIKENTRINNNNINELTVQIQQDSINTHKEDVVDSSNFHSTPPTSNNSSPHHAHHMPLPSHTRTTAHGLSPSRQAGRYRSPSPSTRNTVVNPRRSGSKERTSYASPHLRRSESPQRKLSGNSDTGMGYSPRSMSPVIKDRNVKNTRQSLPMMSRGRPSSPKPSLNYGGLSKDNAATPKSNMTRMRPLGTPVTANSDIKSRFGTPRQLKQPARSKLAAPSNASELQKTPRSQTPRRSLPRPSQTTKNQLLHGRPSDDPGSPKYPSSNKTMGSTGTSSPRGSDAGSDVVWSEGEFF